jgi:hypothetical protein
MDLGNYITVDQRLDLALRRHPDLRIIEGPPVIREIGDALYIEVAMTVYRTAEDDNPTIARAWEPWPGKTPFTRDSEMMNCSTSALGRALGLMGFGLMGSIATADEVKLAKTRDPDHNPLMDAVKPASESAKRPGRRTPGQESIIRKMATERGLEPHIPDTFAECSAEIERLKAIRRD